MHKLARPTAEPEVLSEAQSLGANDWESFWHGRITEKTELQQALLDMQDGKCAYCEAKVDLHEGHIEHFRRKNPKWFPELTFVWSNLYYSCCKKGTCGRHKDRVLSRSDVDKLIDPCVDDPEEFLQFTFDGNVTACSNLDNDGLSRAMLTISTFNLRHEELVDARRNTLKGYEWLKKRSAKEIDEYLDDLSSETPFLTAIYHFFGKKRHG